MKRRTFFRNTIGAILGIFIAGKTRGTPIVKQKLYIHRITYQGLSNKKEVLLAANRAGKTDVWSIYDFPPNQSGLFSSLMERNHDET